MGFPVRIAEGIESQELEDELMIMDRPEDRVHVLNSSMAAVWKLCNGRRSEETIAQELTELFECSGVDDLMGSVREALRSLDELGLLRHGVNDAGLE